MKTPISMREPPKGYQEEWDSTLWNVGWIFSWGDAYKTWLDRQIMITVKPGMCLAVAYQERMDQPMLEDDTIFFVKE